MADPLGTSYWTKRFGAEPVLMPSRLLEVVAMLEILQTYVMLFYVTRYTSHSFN